MGGGADPTGTVTFYDGGTKLGTAQLAYYGTYDTVYSFTTSALGPGAHTITAVSSGDGNYQGSTSQALKQVVDSAASVGRVASAITHSAEYYTDFVTHAYQAYLGRSPEAAGLAGWVAAMQNGLSDEWLEAGFIGSTEYINNHGGPGAGWVTGMYQDLLGRTPSQAEVDGWVYALNHGVSPQQVAYGFAASVEREGIRVRDDYFTYLGRTPSQAEVDGWVYAFEHGVSNEDVMAGFVGSREYYLDHGGTVGQWLSSAYQSVLGRRPSSDEMNGWAPALGGI
jgi:hypothetical protein